MRTPLQCGLAELYSRMEEQDLPPSAPTPFRFETSGLWGGEAFPPKGDRTAAGMAAAGQPKTRTEGARRILHYSTVEKAYERFAFARTHGLGSRSRASTRSVRLLAGKQNANSLLGPVEGNSARRWNAGSHCTLAAARLD